MDTVQGTLFLLGIGLVLIPLDWIQSVFFGKGGPVTMWTLLVPFVGMCMIGISLLSYHKDALRVIFYGVCKTIDQTGLGLGFATDLIGVVGGKTHMSSPPEGFTAASELPPQVPLNPST